jgi:DNA-binding CsgD family transcriptional regulator
MPSPRQKEILTWVSEGKTAWEIATILGISRRTVEWHLTSIRAKVNATNITHAVAMCLKTGIITVFGTGMSGVGIASALEIPIKLGHNKGLLFNVLFGLIS